MEESILRSKSRRTFLKRLGLGVTGTAFLSDYQAKVFTDYFLKEDLLSLTVLHTNDMHSRIYPFPADHKKYSGRGGILAVAKKINQIRGEKGEILLLDAGDVFQGTPYFNFYGGDLELKLMSALKYDCGTMGNHDFDNGLEGFAKALPHAKFPFVTSNYDFSDTLLNGKTKPYTILNKKGLRIGLFGLGVNLDGLVNPKLFGNTIYQDPIEKANFHASLLRKDKKCDIVICLSHLGYDYKNTIICDKDLAKKTSNIDLIIGGHTHTFMEKAEALTNRDGKKVLVNQVGWSALSLGRVDFFFSKKKNQVIGLEEASLGVKNCANF